jgi:hypothetical protein
MYAEFLKATMDDRQRQLEEQVRSAYLRRNGAETPETSSDAVVVLRLCTVQDDAALDRIAELEGVPAPKGRHVVAEVDGRVVAALPLAGGAVIADPFRPTAHLEPLLELRAKQLAPDRDGRSIFGLRHAVRAWGRA